MNMYKWLKVKASVLNFQHILQVHPLPNLCKGHILQNSTYLLTYSMVQSPSWETNWFAASQEIPRFSRNPKVHYRTHKCPPTVSILDQPNRVHIPTSHLLEIHLIIIHPSLQNPTQVKFYVSWNFPKCY